MIGSTTLRTFCRLIETTACDLYSLPARAFSILRSSRASTRRNKLRAAFNIYRDFNARFFAFPALATRPSSFIRALFCGFSACGRSILATFQVNPSKRYPLRTRRISASGQQHPDFLRSPNHFPLVAPWLAQWVSQCLCSNQQYCGQRLEGLFPQISLFAVGMRSSCDCARIKHVLAPSNLYRRSHQRPCTSSHSLFLVLSKQARRKRI